MLPLPVGDAECDRYVTRVPSVCDQHLTPFREYSTTFGEELSQLREHSTPFREHLTPIREHLTPFREDLTTTGEHLTLFREHLTHQRRWRPMPIWNRPRGSASLCRQGSGSLKEQKLSQTKPNQAKQNPKREKKATSKANGNQTNNSRSRGFASLCPLSSDQHKYIYNHNLFYKLCDSLYSYYVCYVRCYYLKVYITSYFKKRQLDRRPHLQSRGLPVPTKKAQASIETCKDGCWWVLITM
jgi:hypothetical protein